MERKQIIADLHAARSLLSDRNARVGLLQDLVDRIRKVIEERGDEMADVPGGSSGLLVKTYKGKNAQTPVYKFDAALVKQMNAICKQAAIEVGQWDDKRAIGCGTTSRWLRYG